MIEKTNTKHKNTRNRITWRRPNDRDCEQSRPFLVEASNKTRERERKDSIFTTTRQISHKKSCRTDQGAIQQLVVGARCLCACLVCSLFFFESFVCQPALRCRWRRSFTLMCFKERIALAKCQRVDASFTYQIDKLNKRMIKQRRKKTRRTKSCLFVRKHAKVVVVVTRRLAKQSLCARARQSARSGHNFAAACVAALVFVFFRNERSPVVAPR